MWPQKLELHFEMFLQSWKLMHIVYTDVKFH